MCLCQNQELQLNKTDQSGFSKLRLIPALQILRIVPQVTNPLSNLNNAAKQANMEVCFKVSLLNEIIALVPCIMNLWQSRSLRDCYSRRCNRSELRRILQFHDLALQNCIPVLLQVYVNLFGALNITGSSNRSSMKVMDLFLLLPY